METLFFVAVAFAIGGTGGYLYAKRKYGLSKKAD